MKIGTKETGEIQQLKRVEKKKGQATCIAPLQPLTAAAFRP